MEVAELSEKNTLNMLHGEHIILRLPYISRYNNDYPNGGSHAYPSAGAAE
ncbi:hypothetical protein [Psychrobacter immobilis]|nr:hypothetical protein [Psychrobacter immobilis]